jgi:uncharacterized protein (TIGR03086 family)
MTWTADTVYLEGLDVFSGVVGSLAAGDWERPSPCAGWRALDVLGHVGAATEFGTRLLTTGEMEWQEQESPGASVRGDPATWWTERAAAARPAVTGVDLAKVVESPMGSRTIAEGLAFPAIDLFVHAWDLAATVGGHVTLPDEPIAFARATFAALPAEMVRSHGIFGPEQPAPEGASASDTFLAWTGRDPAWTPSA